MLRTFLFVLVVLAGLMIPFSTQAIGSELSDEKLVENPNLGINPIPTLSEWGVIIFGLLLLAVGMVFVLRYSSGLVPAEASSMPLRRSTKQTLYDKELFGKALMIVFVMAFVALAAVAWKFGSVTPTDVGGTIASSFIVAYMIHLGIIPRH